MSSLLPLIYDTNGTTLKKIVSSDGIHSYPDDGEHYTRCVRDATDEEFNSATTK